MSNTDNIIIDNKSVLVNVEEVNIFDLKYYRENPRINYILSKLGGNIDQETIENSLWKLDSTMELATDIKNNGGLIEEVLVLNDEVIEGNTRLCVYRNLYKNADNTEKQKWSKIRAKVILSELAPKDVFLLLGKIHIQGKTPWDPYEKASYIYKMMNENNMLIEEIADIVRMQPSKIKIQLAAYELMRIKYLPKVSKLTTTDEQAELKKFSMFEEYFKNSELQNLKKDSKEIINDDLFVTWVYEQRVRSAAYDVKKDLHQILKSKPARNVFIESDPTEAIPAAKEKLAFEKPETADEFIKKLKDFTEFIKSVEMLEVKEKIEANTRSIDIVRKLHNEINRFYNSLNIHNPNKEFIKVHRRK